MKSFDEALEVQAIMTAVAAVEVGCLPPECIMKYRFNEVVKDYPANWDMWQPFTPQETADMIGGGYDADDDVITGLFMAPEETEPSPEPEEEVTLESVVADAVEDIFSRNDEILKNVEALGPRGTTVLIACMLDGKSYEQALADYQYIIEREKEQEEEAEAEKEDPSKKPTSLEELLNSILYAKVN